MWWAIITDPHILFFYDCTVANNVIHFHCRTFFLLQTHNSEILNISSVRLSLMKVKFVIEYSFYCRLEGMTAMYKCTVIDISEYSNNMNILGSWPMCHYHFYRKLQFPFPFQKPTFINFVFPGTVLQDQDAM